MALPDISNENRFLGDLATPSFRVSLAIGVIGLGLAAAIWKTGGMEAERFLRAYLVGFIVVLSLCLGGLFFVLIHHLTRAGWSVVVRRIAEGLAANLKWIWILFIPILIGLYTTDLYAWVHPAEGDHLMEGKAKYLNTTFWTIRAVIYFAIWAWMARYFVGRSMEQDETGDAKLTTRMQKVAAPGMILYALTQSYAFIDWVMTLEPAWFSTMFGVYFFAASSCGAFATMILILTALHRSGRLKNVVTTEHMHDLGKLLFGFGIAFWAYIAFSQYMLIWYANIPEETSWYIIRQLGGWGVIAIVLVIGRFLAPFLGLISRWPKRWPNALAFGAAWMLVMHVADMYWVIMPTYPHEMAAEAESYVALTEAFNAGRAQYDVHLSMVDFLLPIAMLGFLVAGTSRALRDRSLIPNRDPRLDESLAFMNY